jgi:hypothetical protein
MPGVRIQHPTERNVTFTLVDGSRPYTQPFECGMCHLTHLFKTYHFALDESGAAIVSVEIVERLKRLHGHGFVIANEVAKPPPQRLVPGALLDKVPIISHPQLKEPR